MLKDPNFPVAGIHGTADVIVPVLRLERIQRTGPMPATHLLAPVAEMPVLESNSHPALPGNSNGRMDFPGPTEEET